MTEQDANERRNRLSPEAIRRIVDTSRKAQGLPPVPTDPAALARIARILRQAMEQ